MSACQCGHHEPEHKVNGWASTCQWRGCACPSFRASAPEPVKAEPFQHTTEHRAVFGLGPLPAPLGPNFGLDPIADPQADAEAEINAEVKASIKRVLGTLVAGFDRSPVRTLRLLEQYAHNQREVLASLAIDDEPDKSRPFGGDGTAGLMGLMREMVDIYREALPVAGKAASSERSGAWVEPHAPAWTKLVSVVETVIDGDMGDSALDTTENATVYEDV